MWKWSKNRDFFRFFRIRRFGHFGRIFGAEYSADFDRIFGRIFGIRSYTTSNQLRMSKTAIILQSISEAYVLQNSSKFISRKIWVVSKILEFWHHDHLLHIGCIRENCFLPKNDDMVLWGLLNDRSIMENAAFFLWKRRLFVFGEVQRLFDFNTYCS